MTRFRTHTFMRTITTAAIATTALSLGGCASTGSTTATGSPYTTPSDAMRNPLRAQELTMQAADLIDTDPARAESLLREALAADLYHGPAHNNLGVIYLNQSKLYEAANEFEWARKLMPGHPDPRMNLALTLESAGRIEEALAIYGTALEVYENHIPTIQALVRCQLRNGKENEHTESYLDLVAMRGLDQQWREWAQRKISRRDSGH